MSSSIPKILLGALIVLIISAVVIAILALALMYLIPLATMGAFAPDFHASIAIITLAVFARALVFQN